MENIKNIFLVAIISVLGISQLASIEQKGQTSQGSINKSRLDSLARVFNDKIDNLERKMDAFNDKIDNITGTGFRTVFSLNLNQIESKLDHLEDEIDDVKGSSISFTSSSIRSLKSEIDDLEDEIDDLKSDSHNH